ncbi:hypothetical protein GCM10011588_19570 [Nocardia jinanensis]|uniref:Glycosyltransferase RgtA/B/C/D-like domain-containing protein n=2 Tax=Nocardia jinanensis TaxID=382504 RepID=A0A917RFR0_9NOCA|nr:hypothetical protein GCM10011588_19570 [Nocardia jinanensis]
MADGTVGPDLRDEQLEHAATASSAGVASVALLWATVRRHFGPAAGLLAGLLLALTPVAALMFRFNNPEALLVFLMLAAVWAMSRALGDGRWRWLARRPRCRPDPAADRRWSRCRRSSSPDWPDRWHTRWRPFAPRIGSTPLAGPQIERAMPGPPGGTAGPGKPGGPGSSGGPGSGHGRPDGRAGGPPGGPLAAADPTVTALLDRDADHYTWTAVTVGSMQQGTYQLAGEGQIMAIGGFAGGDPSPTLERFQRCGRR